MSDEIYREGDIVSMRRWDLSERPENRYGDSVVTTIRHGVRNCESGTMVTVRSLKNPTRVQELDKNWLKKI